MLQIVSPYDASTRRNIGAYYTSNGIAAALAEWAIRGPHDRVLEPSFGGGALIEAAIDRLSALHSTLQPGQIVGYDTDHSARKLFQEKLNSPTNPELITADFLSVHVTSSEDAFECVIANPPFVRHHRNTDALFKERCEQLGLPKSSDLSCLFVLHAMKFLKPHGRMAFVLPASFLFANYAEIVRQTLQKRFRYVRTIRLAFRSFAEAGAEEKGVLILADGFGSASPRPWDETVAWSEGDLFELIRGSSRVLPSVATELASLSEGAETIKFDQLATIQIGVVTGANRYFVINEEIRREHNLPHTALVPIAARTSQITGLRFDLRNHAAQSKIGKRVWLLSPRSLGGSGHAVRRYLEKIPKTVRDETLWFRKRPQWFKPEPIFADAVFTYMNHHGPRIALLSSKATATNTFHLVTFKHRLASIDKQRMALALLTSLSQASAEIEGRAYGGGLLKLEPAGARRLVLPNFVPKPDILREAFIAADIHLRAGNCLAARDVADRILLYPSISKDPESTTLSIQRLIEYNRKVRTNSLKSTTP